MRARHNREPLFYFGRYTGETPGGSWNPNNITLNQQNADEINNIAREIREQSEFREDIETSKGLFAVPEYGEMLTRWDMLSAPPDFLISNTSMLNVMLMRETEAPIFQRTRDWLNSNPKNQFTLVVDELHAYRGLPELKLPLHQGNSSAD